MGETTTAVEDKILTSFIIFGVEVGGDFSVSCHRGSYMSVHVLLILLNELGKRDQMRGLPSILSLFMATSLLNSINSNNKLNNTRA